MSPLKEIGPERFMLSTLRQLLAAPVAELSADQTERFHVATCVLALEIAYTDGEFSPEEREHIVSGVCKHFELSAGEAEDLIQASVAVKSKAVDLWKFTNHVNNACSPSEKAAIVETLWRIIYADGTLDAHEDHLIHKLGRLLNIDHPTLIRLKLRVLGEIRAGN